MTGIKCQVLEPYNREETNQLWGKDLGGEGEAAKFEDWREISQRDQCGTLDWILEKKENVDGKTDNSQRECGVYSNGPTSIS